MVDFISKKGKNPNLQASAGVTEYPGSGATLGFLANTYIYSKILFWETIGKAVYCRLAKAIIVYSSISKLKLIDH